MRISDWSSDVCNASIRHLLAVIDDSDTSDCVRSERAFLLGLGAGCHSPVAALARIEDEGIFLKAEILSIDGTEHVAGEARFHREIGRASCRESGCQYV